VPENGSALAFSQSMGVHRANDFLMFGRQLTVEELEQWGMVNRIFPTEGFHDSVKRFLEGQLRVNDGKSMMEMKRLQNAPLRDARILAVYNSVDALAERLVADAPIKRFEEKQKLLDCKSVSLHRWLELYVLTHASKIQESTLQDLNRSPVSSKFTQVALHNYDGFNDFIVFYISSLDKRCYL
jgi:enoyl-CoA hydratase/carnithine racemase